MQQALWISLCRSNAILGQRTGIGEGFIKMIQIYGHTGLEILIRRSTTNSSKAFRKLAHGAKPTGIRRSHHRRIRIPWDKGRTVRMETFDLFFAASYFSVLLLLSRTEPGSRQARILFTNTWAGVFRSANTIFISPSQYLSNSLLVPVALTRRKPVREA